MTQISSLLAASAKSKMILEQASVALQAGDKGDAERLLRHHLLVQPNDAAALDKLAGLAIGAGNVEEATMLLRRAAGSDPTVTRLQSLIFHLQTQVGAQAALDEINKLPSVYRTDFIILACEAACLGRLGNHVRQIEIYKALERSDPRNAPLLKSLADAYKTVGRIDDAVAAAKRAIEADPGYGEAWWTLSNFKSYEFNRREISTMRKMLRRHRSESDALHLHFALGTAFGQHGDYANSFRHFEAGNAIRRNGLSIEAMCITPLIDQAIAAYDAALFERHKLAGHPAKDPIFVVGLHRSGSTLIEQILASHPLIEGTAELTVMQQIWERLARFAELHGRNPFEELRDLDSETLTAIGEEYVERTRDFRVTDRPYFVDKLPANWLQIGLIRLALPNATIIEARRNPMACGFSNFCQNYASGVRFSYSLESIGIFYRDYLRFCEHIDAIQPGAVHRVVNEQLIADPEAETRAMLKAIGVPFDPACLEFHKNGRAVATPSAEQVRRPINREGVDHWRHYESWLGPLRDALGRAIETWDWPFCATQVRH